MRGLFRRERTESDEPWVDPHEVKSLLPASVKHPEANRFTPLGTDFTGEEGSDEDIEFLTSLLSAVEQDKPAPTRPKHFAPPQKEVPVREDTALNYFREIRDDRDERPPLNIEVEEVEMDDLLEELSTTAAALRKRKAA